MGAKEYVESLLRQYRRLAQRNRDAVAAARWLSEQYKCEARAEVYGLVAEELEGVLRLMNEEKPAGAPTPTSFKG